MAARRMQIDLSENIFAMVESMADEDATSKVHVIRKAITVLWEIKKCSKGKGPIELTAGDREVKILIM